MTELKLFGIPYQWVQLLCGLDFLSGSPKVSTHLPYCWISKGAGVFFFIARFEFLHSF